MSLEIKKSCIAAEAANAARKLKRRGFEESYFLFFKGNDEEAASTSDDFFNEGFLFFGASHRQSTSRGEDPQRMRAGGSDHSCQRGLEGMGSLKGFLEHTRADYSIIEFTF